MEKVCGNCRFFRTTEERVDGFIGVCRLEKMIGVFRDSMRSCPSFSLPGSEVLPPPSSTRRSVGPRRRTEIAPMKRPEVGTTELADAFAALDPTALKMVVVELLQASAPLPLTELGGRYGGDLVITPADQDLKPKELPLDQYIGKMVTIRDNLRVLEQKINSHKGLAADEKLDFQVRITRAHSALLSAAGRWAPPEDSQADATARRLLLRLAREGEWKALALPGPGMGDRWRGGSAYYGTPEDGVEEPLEIFFHRLCVVRDRLFALEAVIQTHSKLAGEQADSMSQYLRRSYGTLTTFNLLFRDREDYFSSSR